jgi:hypothetical protein
MNALRPLVLLPLAALAGASLAIVGPRAEAADAAAADGAAALKSAAAEVDAAVKAKDDAAGGAAAKKIPPLYKGTTDAGARTAAAKALGSAVKNAKLAGGRKEALAALVETEDGKEGWKTLQGAYPADDAVDETMFNAEIVKAIGTFHQDAAIDRLLETYKKAKQAELSAGAVTALGGYHTSKQRERILVDIVKTARNLAPGTTRDKAASPEATERWKTVGEATAAALDALTATKGGSAADWMKRVDEAKGNLKSLFKD